MIFDIIYLRIAGLIGRNSTVWERIATERLQILWRFQSLKIILKTVTLIFKTNFERLSRPLNYKLGRVLELVQVFNDKLLATIHCFNYFYIMPIGHLI